METTNHHICDGSSEENIILKGYGVQLVINKRLYNRCFLKAGANFDSRMYRWDHEASRRYRNLSKEDKALRYVIMIEVSTNVMFYEDFNPRMHTKESFAKNVGKSCTIHSFKQYLNDVRATVKYWNKVYDEYRDQYRKAEQKVEENAGMFEIKTRPLNEVEEERERRLKNLLQE